MRSKVGINIMVLRAEHNMSQDKFAKFIGVSPRTLRRWEAGEREPSLKHSKTIIDKFKIEDVYTFLFGEKPKEIPKLVYL